MPVQQRPKLKTPPGAIDTQMHVCGSEDEFPPAPSAAFLPPPARVADYQKIQARTGLERVVVVQASAYGTDNRCTMDAVARLGRDRARAVVVVDQTATDTELERLTRAGARGIRFHMFQGGVLPWQSSRRWRRASVPSAGISSFSTTGATSPSARPC